MPANKDVCAIRDANETACRRGKHSHSLIQAIAAIALAETQRATESGWLADCKWQSNNRLLHPLSIKLECSFPPVNFALQASTASSFREYNYITDVSVRKGLLENEGRSVYLIVQSNTFTARHRWCSMRRQTWAGGDRPPIAAASGCSDCPHRRGPSSSSERETGRAEGDTVCEYLRCVRRLSRLFVVASTETRHSN